jgi:hypothetical protein
MPPKLAKRENRIKNKLTKLSISKSERLSDAKKIDKKKKPKDSGFDYK